VRFSVTVQVTGSNKMSICVELETVVTDSKLLSRNSPGTNQKTQIRDSNS
jgi:hypothetical protein